MSECFLENFLRVKVSRATSQPLMRRIVIRIINHTRSIAFSSSSSFLIFLYMFLRTHKIVIAQIVVATANRTYIARNIAITKGSIFSCMWVVTNPFRFIRSLWHDMVNIAPTTTLFQENFTDFLQNFMACVLFAFLSQAYDFLRTNLLNLEYTVFLYGL